ncbi:MAG: hypothetical protein JST26_12765 [Bacteroidetes bacterium]|nr:hypothetical protein [Bacteroidota bacterium]
MKTLILNRSFLTKPAAYFAFILLFALPLTSMAQAKPKPKPTKKPAAANTATTSTTATTTPQTNTVSASSTPTETTTPATTPATTTPTVASTPEPVRPKLTDPLPLKDLPSDPPAMEEAVPTNTWVNPAHTQEKYMNIKEGWFLGADVGSTLFYGDVALYNVFPKYKDFGASFGNGYSFYFGKKFLYGLSAEVQGFKGTLRGEKRADNLYPRYFRGDVIDYSLSVKYNLSQLVFREIPGRKFFNRFTVYITVGGGQTLFRSRLYKYARNDQWYLEKATGYTTVGVDSAGASSAGGLVATKTKFQSAIIIPAGGKIHFKLNAQTDIVLDGRYVTVFSDKMDSWERTWSHKDKYLYTGIGINYNMFAKAEGDIPDDQRIFRPHHKSKDAYAGTTSSSQSAYPTPSGKRSGKGKKADKDLEIKLKLYELQLKLFEMQYMLTN